MFDAKKGSQAPAKPTAKAGKHKISKKQADLIAEALKKHAAQKPVVHVSVHTPGTHVDSPMASDNSSKSVPVDWDEDD